MQTLLLAEPWEWLLGTHRPLEPGIAVEGAGSARLLTSLPKEASSRPAATLPTGKAPLPACSFPFLLGPDPAQTWHLPTDASTHRRRDDFPVVVSVSNESFDLLQQGVVLRPPPQAAEDGFVGLMGRAVAQWVDWQVRGFQELGHLPEDHDGDLEAATRSSIVRRKWESAQEVWLKTETETARMALIVLLSRDQQLHRALESVSRHPRRILQRYRTDTPLPRIQELDSACIRDFARRPGITAVEKAGSRQRLLAVLRREQRNTFENRVATWVMEAAADLAREYAVANASFDSDPKVSNVRRFGNRSAEWRRSEDLLDVASLVHHTESPNYPLQFEARYKLVWKTYRRILREKKVEDDAWAWQRVLWGETGRQLVACCLNRMFKPIAISTPFYRTESRQGCWTEQPVAPGPFRSQSGDFLLFDCRDLDDASGHARRRWIERPPFRGAQYLGASGCDQVLLWPKSNRALLVWHFYHASLGRAEGGLQGILARCARALEQLESDVRRYAQSPAHLSGLLLVADLGRSATQDARQNDRCVALEPGPRLTSGGGVNALCLPPDVDAWRRFSTDLKEGFELVVEETLRTT